MTEQSMFRYLCPSLIQENDMREELKRRHFNIRGLERKNRDELTQIFIRHLMPFPQRHFPDNYQGRLINRMIQKENSQSRRNIKNEENKSTVQYGFSDSKEHKPSSSLQGKSNHSPIQRERLKPPVDSSEIQTKKISLTNTSSSSTILDKVIVKDRTKEKLVSNNSESGRRKSSEEFEVKKAELKRTHSEEKSDDDASSPNKKARQRIAWP